MKRNNKQSILTILSVLAVWLYSFTSMADDGGNKWVVGSQEAAKGTTEVTVPIYINNAVSITGIQFDLYLGDGVEVKTTGRTKSLVIEKGFDRFEDLDHSLSSEVQSDGSIRILCASVTNKPIWDDDIDGNDIRLSAPVFNITLLVPDETGVYDIECRNIVLSSYESGKTLKYNLEDCSSYIAVKPVSGNELKTKGNVLSVLTAGKIGKEEYKELLQSGTNVVSVDLRAAELDDDITCVDDLRTEQTNDNTLFILPSGSKLAGKNAIIDGRCEELELTDGVLFGSDQSFKAGMVKYSRSFKNHSWQPLYLPFDVSISNMSDNFEIAQFCINQTDDSHIVIENVTEGTLTANTPYLIKLKDGKDTGDYDIPGESNISKSIEKGIQIGDYYVLKTTYKPLSGEELQGKFALVNGSFVQAGSNASLKAFRIYLESVSGEAKEIRLVFDDLTDSCPNIRSVMAPLNYYDIHGRRLNMPQYGINVIDGRLVFINK